MSDFTNDFNGTESAFDAAPQLENMNPVTIDDIDLSVLLGFEEAQGEGEPDLIIELIDLYLDDCPRQLSVMKDSVLKADEISLKRAAHTLKGSSANLGVNSVAGFCAEIEETDVSQSFLESNVLINRLEQTFARVQTIFLAERQSRI